MAPVVSFLLARRHTGGRSSRWWRWRQWPRWLSQQQVRAQGRRTALWDKVFTAEQAPKGKTTTRPPAPAVTAWTWAAAAAPAAGQRVPDKWDFQSVNQLYTEMKSRMPRDQPGR